jgi:small-conductance mechanosensitive channel
MIIWSGLIQHTLWIIGLAILLATFSLAHWTASLQKRSLRQSLRQPAYRLTIAAGILAFALGLMFLAEALWLKIAWMGVIVLSLGEGISAGRDCFGKARRS